MSADSVLDTLERLLTKVQHPDIAEVYRYGVEPQAVGIVYQSKAKAFIWPAPGKPRTEPAELPEDLGDYRARVRFVIRLLVDLLDIVKPEGWVWRTVNVEGTHLSPCGLEVKAGGLNPAAGDLGRRARPGL